MLANYLNKAKNIKIILPYSNISELCIEFNEIRIKVIRLMAHEFANLSTKNCSNISFYDDMPKKSLSTTCLTSIRPLF